MVKSFLNGINNLIGGEFLEKEIYSIYGVASVGKSVYLIGEALNLIANGWRVVWIDTEGGFQGNFNVWEPIYEKRFGKINLDNFHYYRVLSVEEFCELFGMQVKVDYGDSKMEVTPTSVNEKLSELYEKYGRLRGKVAVIVDSMSSPIRLQFTSKVQNFSGRADAESLMLLNLIKFAEKTNAFVLLSNHESKNPTDNYLPQGSLRGGSTLKYYSKYILQFVKPMKKAWGDFRQVIAVRTPIARDNELSEWIKLTSNGYEDSSIQEVEAVK